MITLKVRRVDHKNNNTPILYDREIDDFAHEVLADYKPGLLREPSAIRFEHFLESYLGVGRSYWESAAIYRILNDERYTGTLVCFKSKRVSRNATGSSSREVKLSQDDWVRVPDALPAIVSTEEFEKANAGRRRFTRTKQANSTKSPRSPFVGKVVCGHCNQSLTLTKTNRPFFRCNNVKHNIGLGCYDGMVRVSDLEEVLLATAQLEARKALDLMEQQQNQKQALSHVSVENNSISSELKRLTANIALLEQRGMALYEAFAEGKVEREDYVAAKATNGVDLEATQNRIAELNQHLVEIENADTVQPNIADESILHCILAATETTGEVLSLLDRMIIYDGGRIEVQFGFSNPLATNEKIGG